MIDTLVSDLDGTLLNAVKEINDDDISMLHQWVELGHHFLPASGRNVEMIRNLAESYHFPCCDMIAYTGAQLLINGETAAEYPIEEQELMNFYTGMSEFNEEIDYQFRGIDNSSFGLHEKGLFYKKLVLGAQMKRSDVVQQPLENYFSLDIKPEIMKIFFVASDDNAVKMGHILHDRFDGIMTVSASGETYYELCSLKANKGIALTEYMRIKGIEPCSVAVVGDAENDISMLQAAGYPFAMQNADPCVKAYGKSAASVADVIRQCMKSNGEQ